MEKPEYSWQGFKEYVTSMVDDHTRRMMQDRDWYINNTDPEYDYPDVQVRLDAINNVLDAVQFIFKDELDKIADTVNEDLDRIKDELDNTEELINTI
tara:strand:- start:353 stop:643 length:291 start_codon:yes stop_codon:yes gene_type:complete